MERKHPGKLFHTVPGWVDPASLYHVRVRCHPCQGSLLKDTGLASAILDAARYYHRIHRWHARLVLLMPDHLHAILGFGQAERMPRIVGAWKGFLARRHGARWQDNFFDHRLRSVREIEEKAAYIRNNPVVLGLCEKSDDWPWIAEPWKEELAKELGRDIDNTE